MRLNRIFDIIDDLDQIAFLAVAATAIGVGTCWAVSKILASKIINRNNFETRAK